MNPVTLKFHFYGPAAQGGERYCYSDPIPETFATLKEGLETAITVAPRISPKVELIRVDWVGTDKTQWWMRKEDGTWERSDAEGAAVSSQGRT